jgi:hypothetical protein
MKQSQETRRPFFHDFLGVIVVGMWVIAASGLIYAVSSGKLTQSPVLMQAATAPPPAATTPPPVNKVVIKELGVEFTPISEIGMDGLVYRVRVDAQGRTIADFSSRYLTTIAGEACDADRDAPLGSISLDSNSNFSLGRVKKLGSQYLFWSPGIPCTRDDWGVEVANRQLFALRGSLGTAQLIQY